MISAGKNMTNLDYHKKVIEYNLLTMTRAIMFDIKSNIQTFLDGKITDLDEDLKVALGRDLDKIKNNPNKIDEILDKKATKIINNLPKKFKQKYVNQLPFTPKFHGELVEKFGIDVEITDTRLWEHVSMGTIPIDMLKPNFINENPQIETIDNAKYGKLILLNGNVPKFDKDGEYMEFKMNKEAKTEAQKGKRIGTEFVLSMPHNCSIMFAMLQSNGVDVDKLVNDKIQDVIDKVVLPKMAKLAYIRKSQDNVKYRVPTSGLLAASFLHTENRALDPFYHTHLILNNTCIGEDGKLYSLNNEDIMSNKDEISAAFQQEMLNWVKEQFGVETKVVYTRKDRLNQNLHNENKEIAGWDIEDKYLTRDVIKDCSKRERQMLKGINGSAAEREYTRLEQREDKTQKNYKELQQHWREIFSKYSVNGKSVFENLVSQLRDTKHVFKPNANIFADEIRQDQVVDILEKKTISKRDDEIFDTVNRVKHLIEKQKNGKINHLDEAELYRYSQNIDNALETIFRVKTQVCFTEAQFKGHIIRHYMNDYSPDAIERFADFVFKQRCVARVDPKIKEEFLQWVEINGQNHIEYEKRYHQFMSNVKYTTNEMILKEKAIVQYAKKYIDDERYVISKEIILDGIKRFEEQKGYKISNDQYNGVMNGLSRPGLVEVLQGHAGAGKSTVAGLITDIYRQQGHRVIVTSTSQSATEVIANDTNSIKDDSYNMTKLLLEIKNGNVVLKEGDVIMIDEAGMVSSLARYELYKYANAHKIKIHELGEGSQLQPVEAGGVYAYMEKNERITTKLTKINRQNNDFDKEMIKAMVDGQSEKSMMLLMNRMLGEQVVKVNGETELADDDKVKRVSRLQHADTVEEQYKILVNLYLEDKNDLNTKFIVTSQNRHADTMNLMIRDELIKKGVLNNKEEVVNFKDADELESKMNLQVGERIVFTKNMKSVSVDEKAMEKSYEKRIESFKAKFPNKSTDHIKPNKKPIFKQVNNNDICMINSFVKNTHGEITHIRLSKLTNGKPGPELTVATSDEIMQNVKYASVVTTMKSQGQTKVSCYLMGDGDNNNMYVGMSRFRQNLVVVTNKNEIQKQIDKQIEYANTHFKNAVDHTPDETMKKWVSNVYKDLSDKNKQVLFNERRVPNVNDFQSIVNFFKYLRDRSILDNREDGLKDDNFALHKTPTPEMTKAYNELIHKIKEENEFKFKLLATNNQLPNMKSFIEVRDFLNLHGDKKILAKIKYESDPKDLIKNGEELLNAFYKRYEKMLINKLPDNVKNHELWEKTSEEDKLKLARMQLMTNKFNISNKKMTTLSMVGGDDLDKLIDDFKVKFGYKKAEPPAPTHRIAELQRQSNENYRFSKKPKQKVNAHTETPVINTPQTVKPGAFRPKIVQAMKNIKQSLSFNKEKFVKSSINVIGIVNKNINNIINKPADAIKVPPQVVKRKKIK